MIGTRLGPYEILQQLGAGGMGEVWLAQDTRLGRKVAIKVLPAQFAADRERLARFEQEARAAAALNHPNIAVVHDVGHAAGPDGAATHFMVQEYLQGQSLRDALQRGAMPLQRALSLAGEITEGLAAAHAAGIVHRDLKPENVFVTAQGHAKILDFGLAKLTEVAAPAGSATQSPTVLGTQAGAIMGTAGYMAPEQITGEEVDARADVFAFGCVLYEMVAGERAFGGKNLPEVLHRLANEDPRGLAEIAPELPAELGRIARKCLAKEPARRYQGAADLAVDIRALLADVDAGRAAPLQASGSARLSRRPTPLSAAALILAGLLLGAGAWALLGGGTAPGSARALHLPLREVPGLDNENWAQMAISPDGRYLAFATGRGALRLWNLDEAESERLIAETDGARVPFFTPDSAWVTYLAPDNRLYRVPTQGGRPQPVSDRIGGQLGQAFWRDDGDIVFMANFSDPVMMLPAGGAPSALIDLDTEAGEIGHASASFLPDGDHLLYSFWDDRWRIAVRSMSTGERVVLTEGFAPRYVPTGHLVWVMARSLMAATFDPGTFELGEPLQLVTVVGSHAGWGRSGYDFSADGTLAYLEAPADRTTDLLRIDRTGRATVLRPGDREFRRVRTTPAGDRLALELSTTDGDAQIWAYDLARADLVPIAQGEGWDQTPDFSPDGTVILWTSERLGSGDVFVRPADGTGAETPLLTGSTYKNNVSWSRLGVIAVVREGRFGEGSRDILLHFPDDPERVEPLVETPADDWVPDFSPDGRFLAFASNRTGRYEIYVTQYPGGLGALEWKVSTDGGAEPRWSHDGSSLFFLDPYGRVMRAAVLDTEPFRTAPPERFSDLVVRDFDVEGNGDAIIAVEALPPPRPYLVLNWFAELERKLPHR